MKSFEINCKMVQEIEMGMKSIIVAMMVVVSMNAGASPATEEVWCLSLGDIAGSAAGLYAGGEATETLDAHVDDSKVSPRLKGVFKAINSYVYIMGLKPQEARKSVYLKCVAGEYR